MAKDSLHVYTPSEAANAATAVNAKWNVLTSQNTTKSPNTTYNLDVSDYNQLLITNKGFGIYYSFRSDISSDLSASSHNNQFIIRSDSSLSTGVVSLSIPKNIKYFSFRHTATSAGDTKVFVVGY